MSPLSNDGSPPPATRLLKGAAVFFALLGGGIAAWGIDKWLHYPDVRASQFGFEAPLWPAFVGFILLGTGVGIALLWTTARRVEEGHDLFSNSYRQRPKSDSPSNSL